MINYLKWLKKRISTVSDSKINVEGHGVGHKRASLYLLRSNGKFGKAADSPVEKSGSTACHP